MNSQVERNTGWALSSSRDSGRAASAADVVANQIGVRDLWARGTTGRGVTVAVIDTGIADLPELDGAVVARVDLTGDAGDAQLRHADRVGHGTHIAGIIAATSPDGSGPVGVAPGASLVAVKVGNADGSVHPLQVVEGIDWVVDHCDSLGIRVLNISFGVESTPLGGREILERAVHRAWAAGIVVVASAGNRGADATAMTYPARSPRVIAVANAEQQDGIWGHHTTSSAGDGFRNPDLAAPGRSVVGLLSPGSLAAAEHPEALVGDRYIKGTGSSQAAAVISGCVALLLQDRPWLSPDDVKALLVATAAAMPGSDRRLVGAGLVDMSAVAQAGVGHDADETLLHAVSAWAGASWGGASWGGASWGGASWGGASWGGASWGGASWGGASWGGASWGGASWGGASWGGASWGGASWGGASWGGASWG